MSLLGENKEFEAGMEEIFFLTEVLGTEVSVCIWH